MVSDEILERYYSNNAYKLRKVVDGILNQFGGISQKDYDEFYALASTVFYDAYRGYDGKNDFDKYFFSCLSNKIKTEFTARNRIKRQTDRLASSIEGQLNDKDEFTIGDSLKAPNDTEMEAIGEMSDEMIRYLDGLSNMEKQILALRVEGYTPHEIKAKLELSEEKYQELIDDLQSYEKTMSLRKITTKEARKKEVKQTMPTGTSEVDKATQYSIKTLIDMVDDYSIRDDHPLQRCSEQWTNQMKGNLISTILHQFRIPEIIIVEQLIDGIVVKWLIEGKQRLSTVHGYRNNKFRTCKTIERPVVSYQTTIKDENGNITKDANGNPCYERKEFDIRGKYYRDLPEELQRIFDSYTLNAVIYLNCNDEDIEYHIRRYNSSKPMSVAQKGITHLGEEFARATKKLSRHSFFVDNGDYKAKERINGTVDRVIVETLMLTFFPENWRKKPEDMCSFLKENLRVSSFNEIEETLDRLNEIIDESVADMFNSRDSFLWFTLFHKFEKTELDDGEFLNFLREFKANLHLKEINGDSFDAFNQKSTKDKAIVLEKVNLLEDLMYEYFGMEKPETEMEFQIPESCSDFIKEFENVDIISVVNVGSESETVKMALQSAMLTDGIKDLSDTSVKDVIDNNGINRNQMEDTLLYLDGLNDWSLNVDNNSKIFDKVNIPYLINIVDYVYTNDINEMIAIKWFTNFVDNYDKIGNQSEKPDELYREMIDSLGRYCNYEKSKEVVA